jgi:hypothetical protein
MRIDHHIQQTIALKLAESKDPVIYSDLKQPDIENSLFSYHLNKLIARKMVQKLDGGYSLTVEGARWLHNTDMTARAGKSIPVFVTLVIENESGNYLIGQRAGQFKALINDYVFPGLYYTNDLDLDQQIDQCIDAYIPDGLLLKRTEFGFVQIKAEYTDKSLRCLFNITYCRTKDFDPLKILSMVDFQWMTNEEIDAINHPSAELLRGIIKYTSNTKNTHQTPQFVG